MDAKFAENHKLIRVWGELCLYNLPLVNHLHNYKISPSRGCLCCLATSYSKNAIISVMFDKLPYFGQISSKGPTLDFGLYAILLLIELFWFITMTFNIIRLFRLSIKGYFLNLCNFQ